MSAHDLYVLAAYGLSAVALTAMTVWIMLDHRMRKREIAALESDGVRRRSAKP